MFLNHGSWCCPITDIYVVPNPVMFSKYPSVFGCLYLPLCSPIIDSSHLNCPCGSSKITIHTGGKSPLIYNCLTIDHYYITIWKKWIYSLILSISNIKPHHSFMRPRRPQLWPHVPGVFFYASNILQHFKRSLRTEELSIFLMPSIFPHS